MTAVDSFLKARDFLLNNRIEFSDLPKTISGKIRRVQLRVAEAERRALGEKGALEFFEEDFPELKG